MCIMKGYDVCYAKGGVTLEPHFCRVVDCDGGMEFEDALKEVVEFYKDYAKRIGTVKNYEQYCEIALVP